MEAGMAIMDTFSPSFLVIVSSCVLVPLFSYLIYKFSIKEKSFEEALEEQKRRNLEEEMKQKSEKGKKEKKFKRSWAKKKEKVDQEPVSGASLVEEKKEIPVIEIIEPKETKPLKQKIKKTTAVADAASGADKPMKAEVAVGTDRHVPEKKKDVVPEAKKEVDNVKSSPKQAEISKPKVEVENVKTSSKQTEVSKVKVEATEKPAPVNSTVAKKKKKEQVEKGVKPMSGMELVSLIREIALDTEEIQNVIDILLNKQKDASGWTKRNDQLADTKRSLQEKEQQLDLELRQNQVVVSKLKDVREELNQTKVKYSNLEKSSQDKISRQQQEVQNFTARVKQLQEQCTSEKEKCAQIEKKMDEKLAAAVKNVDDEKIKLQQKLSKLETESRVGISKAEVDTLKKSREDLQKVHSLLIEQHTQLVSSHKNELKNSLIQVADLKKQLDETKAKNTVLTKDVQSLTGVEKKRLSDLEAELKQLSSNHINVNQLQLEVKNLRIENERLTEELVSTKERVAGDGQEIVHENGEMNGRVQDEAALKLLEEKENSLKDKEAALAQLNEKLNNMNAKIELLDKEAESQRKKNNELREKNWKAMDALKKTEEDAEKRIKEIQATSEKKLSEVQKEYEGKLLANSNQQSIFPVEFEERVVKAEAESAKHLSNYNSELEKNKRLTSEVDRLSAQQNSTQSRLSAVEKTVDELNCQIKETQSRTRECLQRIHPEVSVDNSLPHDAWMAEFEKQALAVQAASSNVTDLIAIKDLLEEKERDFSNKEAHFAKVLADTEETLQKLQLTAESKEAVWQERLNQKESELQLILAEKEKLASERDAVQSTFQQIGQLEELKEKLKELQVALESTSNERSQIEQKYDEVHNNCINLRDQLENKEKQILELQKEGSKVEHLRQDIEDLKTKLDKEKKINKDFSSQMIKLNSLVKIGQDSLTAEQEKVKQLESQIKTSQVSATNGGAVISSPVANNEDASAKK